MATTLNQACLTVDFIRSQAIRVIGDFDFRYEMLLRTASYLKAAAALAVIPLIPPIPAIPQLTLDSYLQIQRACPFLHLQGLSADALAALPGLAQLERLKELVFNAYLGYLNSLETSAIGMLDQLEAQLQAEVDRVLKLIGPFDQLVTCLCGAANAIQDASASAKALASYSLLVEKPPTLIDDYLKQQLASYQAVKASFKVALAQ